MPLVLVLSAAVLLAGVWGLPAVSQPPVGSPAAPGAGSAASPSAHASPRRPPARPSGSPGASTGATPSSTPTAGPSAAASPTPKPSPTRHPLAAPASAQDFDLERQLVQLGFPLKPGTRYRYRDNWLDAREGPAEHYNHAHSRRGGQLLRAHDGIDIYARRGQPVVSPFDGVIIDPAARWQPWDPERYGLTAVIVSSEPLSEGYAAILAHLDRLWVEPGQLVRRGEVLGTIGDTGNAEGGPAHLHFELRAPFVLSWLELDEERLVDAFNPYPSLRASDPKRSD